MDCLTVMCQLKSLRNIYILHQGYKVSTMCTFMMVNWACIYLHIFTSQETLNYLVVGNYVWMEILDMPLLMKAKKRSLHLSVHSWISHWTLYVINYERSLILDGGIFWWWLQLHLVIKVWVIFPKMKGARSLKQIYIHIFMLDLSML